MKGLAVSYIIALIIGLIILAVGGYLIYRALSEEALKCKECQAQFTGWCSTCYLSLWSADNPLGDELAECVSDCGYWPSVLPAQNCVGAKLACSGVMEFP